tara:strand:+ start:1882 stop:2139 length:258 start_codon:yes stop_codon:yes gene_type:complete
MSVGDKGSISLGESMPPDHEMISISDLSSRLQSSYNVGFKEGRAKVKSEVLTILKNHSVGLFVAKEDDLAKQIRKCVEHIAEHVE